MGVKGRPGLGRGAGLPSWVKRPQYGDSGVGRTDIEEAIGKRGYSGDPRTRDPVRGGEIFSRGDPS